ncbi:Transcription factor, MADS-box [Penicillium camemberti]|uniref:Transcription factor, MADS-box n=1 Tax=Penicillium camemberti (strain FM 013) TaxID=1429867 RepID=A0A0G4PKL2_PENC3|nr:Transcription factor, MADS-box [Penicillium camemberti]
MASIPPTQSNQPRSIKKSMHQKQGRRKSSLMKRASEYSKMCDADVCVGIRLRETGQVFILSADTSGFWAFLSSQLNSYYPAPKLVIDPDLEQVDKDTSEQHT